MDDHEPRWLSTKEAAQLLEVPVRHLYRLIDEGRLPAYKFGRVIRLQQGEVEVYRDGPDEPDGSAER